jgi:Na+/H+ antiporter NhaD/arsenite permease-like protein
VDLLPALTASVIFLGAYVLIATERIPRTAAALGGAGVMLALGITNAHTAFFAEESGVDWNVIFLLLGMMVIVSVLRVTGVFEYLAIWAAKRAGARPFRLMILLLIITAAASAILDNVTTVLLIAPVTILICQRLALPVIPFLIAEVFAANIGGTATLVGDPPNIIIASRGNLTFNDFLIHLTPLVLVAMIVLVVLCRWMFASAFVVDESRLDGIMRLNEREAIENPRLLVISLSVLALVLVAFVLHPVLGYQPSVVALLGAGLLVAVSRVTTEEALHDVEWSTLAFFMGLFVMVGGLVNTGVLAALSESIAGFAEGNLLAFTQLLLWGSGLLSGIVDNIPYVASMAPVIAGLVGPDGQPQVLWWALALGADFGGNATLIGASANVVVAGIAARNDRPIGFWQFTKYGLIVTAASLLLSSVYLWLRYFAFG